MGIDPVYFGILVIVNTAIGMATPPFGQTLLVVSDISKLSMISIAYRSFIFIGMLLVGLFIMIVFPYLVMFPLWL